MKMLQIHRVKYAREAANVVRCHTISSLNRPTDGSHTFNMLTMLRILYPDAPKELVWAVLEHDMPEKVIGDIPHPAKNAGITNNNQVSYVETIMNTVIFGDDSVQRLSEKDKSWLSGLDMIEFYLWCKDELHLGNRNVEHHIKKIDSGS